MTVQFADRKGSSTPRPNRIPFTSALKTSTILILTLPLTPSTTSLITSTELSLMLPDSVLINVARGGIVVEEDLVQALKEGKIKGAATDVFVTEPAGKENVLVQAAREGSLGGRLVLSPHVAWFARSSIEKLRRVVTENIEGWARGEPLNTVLPA
jgi:lactate dehydrogenase-like 2-hydroxyacid dehydrogenase